MLIKLSDLSEAGQFAALERIREIFFLSTERRFASPEEKDTFYSRWTDYYLGEMRDWIYLAQVNGEIAGYLMGCPVSSAALDYFKKRIQSYAVFEDLFTQYPAHLHINIYPKYRGMGLGKKLVNRFVDDLKAQKISGVHLVTSPGMRNVKFYIDLGFTQQIERSWRGRPLLFLGRSLSGHQEVNLSTMF